MKNFSQTPKPEKTLIFVHIPKTAGSTLSSILERQYDPSKTWKFYPTYSSARESFNYFQKLPESERIKFKLVSGHIYYGLHDLLPQPSTYITMLRDPIDRLVSSYYFIRRHSTHPFHQDAKSMSLIDFFSCVERTRGFNNCQVRFLAGYDGDSVNEEVLSLAKQNLQSSFAVVGLQEKFDESIILMKNLLGWHHHFFYSKKLVSKKRPAKEKLSPAELKIMEKHNELDLELYEYARKIFRARVSELGSDLQRNLKFFRYFNQLYKSYSYFLESSHQVQKKIQSLLHNSNDGISR